MVKIYTRKGDDGTTSLWYGGRVPKSHPRTDAYGTLDEAASALGVARSICTDERLAADILRLQNELFVAGAELATAPEARERLEPGVSRVTEEMVDQAESDIDAYMAEVELPPKFVIPGGTQVSAQLDVARAVLRRAERRIVEIGLEGELGDSSLPRFVNRASDLVFAMARFADEPEPELFEGRGAKAPEKR
jgi:cob(I)alamin adenosyltransferase